MAFQLSRRVLGEVMRSDPVRGALRKKAAVLAPRADALGASEGVDMNARVREGTRPRGRPYARVESDNVEQEWGSRYTERRRILGRIAEGEA